MIDAAKEFGPADRGRLAVAPEWLATWLATGLLVALLVGCGETPPTPEESAVPSVAVTVAVATPETVGDMVEASGVVEPWRRVKPGTKILGRISEVNVREGDRVERGQVLARLEDRDLEAAADQARAGIVMAEAQVENSQAQYDRMVELRGRGSVTAKNLEDATSGHRIAEASLQKARADLAAAEAMLDYARVVSPIAGWVVARNVEAGDMSAPGQPFFTIENLNPAKAIVQVAETHIVGLAAGQPATVVIDALGRSLEVTIDRVVPAGDPASRSFEVQLLLDNADGSIKSGLFVRARFATGERQALRVPDGAVVRRGQLEGLFVIENDRAALRWIRAGRSRDGVTEVLSGLEAGESYVVDPPAGLNDGSPVVVR